MTKSKTSRTSSTSTSRPTSRKRSTSSPRSGSSSKRSRSSNSGLLSGLPSWAVITMGCVGFCGLVYGLMQITAVSEFMEPTIHDVSEYFGLSDDDGIDSENITHDRVYSGMES